MEFELIWENIQEFYFNYEYGFKIAAVFFCTAVMHFILHFIHLKIHRSLKKTHRLWDDALTNAIYIPLKLGIWVIAINVSLEIIHLRFDFDYFDFVKVAYRLVVLFIIFLFFVLFARGIVQQCVKGKRKVDSMTINALSKIYYILISILAGLASLRVLGIPLSAVIAFGGVGGLAVGFAAKDFLANLFGGLMIFIGRPFVIGDTITSPDRQITGTVEEMGWRQVKIRTYERRPLYVPNSLFATIIIENVARMHSRRVLFDLTLSYDDLSVVSQICKDLEKWILSRPDIDSTMVNYVRLMEFGESSLVVRVCCYPATTVFIDTLDIQQEILLKSAEIVMKHGATFAFPTRTIFNPELKNVEKK
ncbi:MAG: mechanosensitive ion channel family protein [Rhabdochlamydiaceae bacterium]|nr:mechanosensitive ion channel family protein [Candidatus Amphrikana amoebophyrae]